jgi:hypothetical protein
VPVVVASLAAFAVAAALALRGAPERPTAAQTAREPSIPRPPPPAVVRTGPTLAARPLEPEALPEPLLSCGGSADRRSDPITRIVRDEGSPTERLPVGDAVEGSLAWLARRGCADGGWPDGDRVPCADSAGGNAAASDVASTAQALLTFFASGYTQRSDDRAGFGRRIGAAVRALRNRQDADGAFGSPGSRTRLRDHAVATLAMVELFGMTDTPIARTPALRALAFLRRARLPGGAWAADRGAGRGDAIATAWACLALTTARLVDEGEELRGKQCPFGSAEDDLLPTRRWAEREVPGARRTVLLALLAALRGESTDGGVLSYAIRDLALENSPEGPSATWTHFAAIAARVAGKDARRVATEALALPLAVTRQAGSDPCDGAGAWEAAVPDADGLGLVAATALRSRTLDLWRATRARGEPEADDAPR